MLDQKGVRVKRRVQGAVGTVERVQYSLGVLHPPSGAAALAMVDCFSLRKCGATTIVSHPYMMDCVPAALVICLVSALSFLSCQSRPTQSLNLLSLDLSTLAFLFRASSQTSAEQNGPGRSGNSLGFAASRGPSRQGRPGSHDNRLRDGIFQAEVPLDDVSDKVYCGGESLADHSAGHRRSCATCTPRGIVGAL